MKRLTTDNPKDNIQAALNLFYIKDRETFVRGGGPAPGYEDISLFDFTRQLIKAHIPDEGLSIDDDSLSTMMGEWLFDDPETTEGLIALLYAAAWAFAELRYRLAAYEDTGLEPEEIRELCTDDVAEIARMFRHMIEDGSIDHLRELVQAEKDGRLVVLPCKVGDTVWYITSTMEICEAEVTGIWLNVYTNPHMWIEIKYYSKIIGEREYKGRVDLMLGKIVFLTRKEAEAALKGIDHE